MYAAGKLTSFDRNMLEMMSSEDEDEEDAREQPEKEVSHIFGCYSSSRDRPEGVQQYTVVLTRAWVVCHQSSDFVIGAHPSFSTVSAYIIVDC